MKINRITLGPVQTNCYIIYDEISGAAAVIDPAYNAPEIKSSADRLGADIEKIIITHSHCDHIGGLKELKALCPSAEVIAHINGKEIMNDPAANLSREIGGRAETFSADRYVAGGDIIILSGEELEVIYTPGHTKDSMSIKYKDIIFCGDTVFRYSIGRTDFPSGNMDTEIASIKDKLLVFDDNTILYPGHGEYTTVGDERRNNPYLGGRSIWK